MTGVQTCALPISIADIYAINKELESYNPELAKKPQVIAANKIDAIYDETTSALPALKGEFEAKGINVYPISAVSGQGLKELLYYVQELLSTIDDTPIIYEQEFDPEMLVLQEEGCTVEYDEKENVYVVEGPKIEKMLGYTNIDSEKGFLFFQKFLRNQGILEELEKLGISEGDTVRIYGLQFDYYKN